MKILKTLPKNDINRLEYSIKLEYSMNYYKEQIDKKDDRIMDLPAQKIF